MFILNLTFSKAVLPLGQAYRDSAMQEANFIQSTNPPRENSLEYYRSLRERVENSPLPFSTNPFFPELSPKEEKEQ